ETARAARGAEGAFPGWGGPARGRGGGYRGTPDRPHEPRHSERGEQKPGHPRPLAYDIEDDASRPGAADDREERPHLQHPVAPGESVVREDLGKDSVLGRAEERALGSHEGKDRERNNTAGRIEPERQRSPHHEHDLNRLHRHDDRALAEPIGEDTGRKRKQYERKCEGDERERGPRLRQGLELGPLGGRV